MVTAVSRASRGPKGSGQPGSGADPVGAIAVIPARGGSKRIPRKNIIPFQGRPMLAWTVEAALVSGCFARVVVSTDDEEIARAGREAGAAVPFLRLGHADDHTPVSAATASTVAQAMEHWGESYDEVVQLMPNCPLRGANDIREALDAFRRHARHFQISACRFRWMNPWWAVRVDERGVPSPLFPAEREMRSQDQEALYCPTGAIWIARASSLLGEGTFYGGGYAFEEVPWQAAVDIDDYEDLEFANAVAAMRSEVTA